ncbi:manganese peroxidase 1 [Phlegmacium glaucopus]|nr:manganese peroxidase 1 [Phlegmacium glaucopus]
MVFSRLSAIITVALGALKLADAATVGAVARAHDACTSLVPIVQLIQTNLFDGGECGEEAHSALRLAFHDAIGFSVNGGKGGGADGSILIFNKTEGLFHANNGIDEITARQFPVFQETGLSAGDFVHLAAAIGTSNCPGAPSLKFFFGRPPPVAAAPDLTVPEPTDSVTAIIARFADAGFSVPEIVTLLSSHTIAAADKVDPTIPGTPFDSTVGTFDTQVFLEVLLKGTLFPGNGSQPGEVLSPLHGEMRLQSDFLIARGPPVSGKKTSAVVTATFKEVMAKMQLLGQDTDNLVDCSSIVPTSAPFDGPIKFPASFSQADVEIACTESPFPSLSTVAGPAPTVAPV